MVLSTIIGIPLGIVAALYRAHLFGRLIVTAAFFGYALPNFVLAILLMLLFSFWLRWLPSAGIGSAAHYVMPVMTISLALLASIVRFTRSSMIDVLAQDYLRTARAKGVREPRVITKHALRNALITVITVLGLQVTNVLGASVIVEWVFAWPGLGQLLVQSALKRDYAVLQFGVIMFSAVVIVVNLAVDVLYSVVDPRIRVRG